MKYGNISTSVDTDSLNNADQLSATFFYFGCNFKCGFCHNYTTLGTVKDILSKNQIELVLRNAKQNWIKTIVISGGEPTIDPNLPDFLKMLKKKGFRTKLDSNGSNPQVLENLLQNELVDYIAMDIKGTQDQYKEITKFSDVKKIQSSIDLIQTMKEYEFRTTVIPLYHNQKKLLEIGEWIKGSNLYALQQFRPDLEQGCLDKKFEQEPTYSQKELNAFGEILKPYFKEVKIRCRQGG